MDFEANTGSGLLWALGFAREHGGAVAASAAYGLEIPQAERFGGVADEFSELVGAPPDDSVVRAAFAVGLLAGRVAHRIPRVRRLQDPTSFVLDSELVVRGAEGQSIMRLPWVEEGLFVGRQLHHISEVPAPLRRQAIENYTAALAGERRRFEFASYGHRYSVDAVPVYGVDGRIEAVLAIATPAPSDTSTAATAAAYERTAVRLEHSASLVEQRAAEERLAGRSPAELEVRDAAARQARQAAERAKATAQRLRAHETGSSVPPAPLLTWREAEVLDLASHGLTSAQIAEHLILSRATVATHLRNIYAKLGVSDRAAAVAYGLRHGIVE